MVSIFPSDGLAWGVGIVVGAALAGIILAAVAFCLRRTLCGSRGEAMLRPQQQQAR